MTNKLGSSNPNRIPKKTTQNKARKILDKSYSDEELEKEVKEAFNLQSKEAYFHNRGSTINNLLDRLDTLTSDDDSVKAQIEEHRQEVEEVKKKHDLEVDEHLKSVAMLAVASKGVDKYGIPKDIGFNTEVEAFKNNSEAVDEFMQIVDELLDEQGDVPKDKYQEVRDYMMSIVLPKAFDVVGEFVGKEFQKEFRKIDDLMDKCIVKDDIKYHYDTLEEIAVDYANMTTKERYANRREAYRDAVDKGITYTSKYGKKEPLKKWKQLERAYDRVIDASKEEELGLIT